MEKPSTPAPAGEKQTTSRPPTSRARAVALPEVDLYIHLIVLLYLIDRNSLKSVSKSSIGVFRRLFSILDCRHLIVRNDWLTKPVF